MRRCEGRFLWVCFSTRNTTEEGALVEERIQAIAERRRHGGRGRVVGRLPATRRARPGGARQVREGSVALLALRAEGPEIRQRRGGRSWRHQDFGCFRVGLSGPVPRVECRPHGVVVSRVPWAGPGGRFTRDFGSGCAWLMTVAGQRTVSGFPHIAWRTAGDIAGRVAGLYLFNGLCAGLSRVCWPCYR